MTARRLLPALVLALWTLLVWTTRIRNIWTDDALEVGGQLWRTALAAAFTAFAVLTVLAWWRARRRAVWSWTPALVRTFAVWTVAVWLVRGTQIVLGDHGAAFIAVHTVLAVVSIGLAVWADRSARSLHEHQEADDGADDDREHPDRDHRRVQSLAPPHAPGL